MYEDVKKISEELAVFGKYPLQITHNHAGLQIEGLNTDKWDAWKWLNNKEQAPSIVELSKEDRDFLISRQWYWDQ
jgi:hypothetical protein